MSIPTPYTPVWEAGGDEGDFLRDAPTPQERSTSDSSEAHETEEGQSRRIGMRRSASGKYGSCGK